MTKRSVVWALLLVAGASGTLRAQDIRGRYVSKTQEDGTIYHTFPCTLFEHPEAGDLTFDITYKERTDGLATLNFTCEMAGAFFSRPVLSCQTFFASSGEAARMNFMGTSPPPTR